MEELIDSIDTDEIMEYKLFNDIHIWPLIRYTCLSHIRKIDDNARNKNIYSFSEKFINLLLGLSNFKIKKAKIVFITSVLFNVKMADGKNKNILDDYYHNIYPNDSYIYEYLAPDTFKTAKNRENRHVSNILSYLDIITTLLSKFALNKQNQEIIFFLNHLRDKGLSEEVLNSVCMRLYKHAREYKIRKTIYQLFLKFVQPKILFINCASYGEKHSIMINEAKKLGVIVCEIQHGGIAKTDFVYNSTRPIDKYKQYMPDYLMTFGKSYNNVADYSIKIPVGHPHLDYKINKNKSSKIIKNSYLVISQWPVLEELINLTESLSIADPNCIINYRLHPLDNLNTQQKIKLNKKNITITKSNEGKDLYDEFNLYENIVGCYSTALIEATAFDRKIYILKHELSLQYDFDKIGILIENGYDIVNCKKEMKCQYFFISGFCDNYRKFIQSLNIIGYKW